MLFTKIVLSLATLAAGVSATQKEFHLKTVSNSPSKNNLFVEAYHTGAGMSEAVLGTSKSAAGKFYLNETYLQMDIGQEFTFGFELGGATNYAGEFCAAVFC